MDRQELALCLEAGFIDLNIDKNEQYLPKILTNNDKKKIKVLQNLLFELENCDDFFFSVAFITNTGIACIADALRYLENKKFEGKYWHHSIKILLSLVLCASC